MLRASPCYVEIVLHHVAHALLSSKYKRNPGAEQHAPMPTNLNSHKVIFFYQGQRMFFVVLVEILITDGAVYVGECMVGDERLETWLFFSLSH